MNQINYAASMNTQDQKAALLLVVPFFNEANRFDSNYWTKINSLTHIKFVFVNDGSTDSTPTLLENLLEVNVHNSRLISLSKNVGKSEAIRIGLIAALEQDSSIQFIGYRDGDQSLSWHDIDKLLSIMRNNKFDVVLGSRVKLLGREVLRNWKRHYIGRVLATLLSTGIDGFPYDSQNGMKIFRNSLEFKAALQEPFKTRWFIDIELLSRLKSQGINRFWEEPLTFWIDSRESHISLKSFPRVFHEILIIRKLLKSWT
jgi:glycosyltransferase involved in cell wall biosynthesis